jgi:hypothetical protein
MRDQLLENAVRLFYETGERIVCVDAPQERHREVLEQRKAADARKLPKDEALALAKQRKIDVEWYDLAGKF